MEKKLTCNSCLRTYSMHKVSLSVTACAHILCTDCCKAMTNSSCPVCQKGTRTVALQQLDKDQQSTYFGDQGSKLKVSRDQNAKQLDSYFRRTQFLDFQKKSLFKFFLSRLSGTKEKEKLHAKEIQFQNLQSEYLKLAEQSKKREQELVNQNVEYKMRVQELSVKVAQMEKNVQAHMMNQPGHHQYQFIENNGPAGYAMAENPIGRRFSFNQNKQRNDSNLSSDTNSFMNSGRDRLNDSASRRKNFAPGVNIDIDAVATAESQNCFPHPGLGRSNASARVNAQFNMMPNPPTVVGPSPNGSMASRNSDLSRNSKASGLLFQNLERNSGRNFYF